MYVKLVGYPDTIYEAGEGAVELGSVPFDSDPVDANLADLLGRVGSHADVYDRTKLEHDPAGYRDGDKDRPFWKIRWARFRQPSADAVKMVMSTSAIYVLSDTGKTIDSIR